MKIKNENGVEMVEFKWFGHGMTPRTVTVTKAWFDRLTNGKGLLQYDKVQEYVKAH